MKRSWFLNTAIICGVIAGAALAEGTSVSPPDFPDFTFKRIGVPQAGGGSLINVQIDPNVQGAGTSAVAAPNIETDLTAPKTDAYAWFWDSVSPARNESGPANIAKALGALRDNPSNPTPRLQNLQNIAALHGLDILRATVGTNISPALVIAVISVESGGDITAASPAGARGIMQLIPATAQRFGVEDSDVAADNIKGGVAYLAWLMNTFANDPILALAGYNAGENAVRKHEGVPPFNETRTYIPRVLTAWQVARGLCLTPPELLTDGCVFAVKGSLDNG